MVDHTGKAALDRALDQDEDLVLVYQPIHHARTGAIYGAEALLRQRRESGELREASIIHEAAEESSSWKLFALDSLLVKRAYIDAARWADGIRLNVNLSPREFQEGNVLERLTALITACGTDVHRVNLEITETSYIDRPDETMDVLVAIKQLGVSLWLDDFGTGHSSLTHLQKFPIDGLKLPGSFVRPLPEDRRCRAIVSALIALAHDVGVPVIAEEVERNEQLELLLELDCDYIQGFLFSRPVPAEEVQATFASFASSGA
ncbi:MAG TPA: EAL domain-containing protein [Thermoanaerobaculia bacterium]|nr:EAL domain-containing protein [Thermoanaerobaculia bacterium]